MWTFETAVSGEQAKNWKVIRTDDYTDACQGELIAADSLAGTFSYKDAAGQTVQKELGPHAIRIVPKK